MDEPVVGIRERTRRAVQAEMFTVAVELFLKQGFDETTVDQIAAAAGVSRRSFFRYFAGKDDVLAQALAGAGQVIATALSERPATEAPWIALRRAFDPLIESMAADERSLPLTRLVLEDPSVLSGHQHKQRSWHQLIAAALCPRLPTGQVADERRLRADAISGAAVACLVSAQAEWVAHNGQRSLSELLDLTMGAVAPIT